MVEIKVQGSQVFVLGNWMDWYDPETDTILDACPIFFEDAELLDIDEDRMVIEVSESSRIWEIDGVGNKKLIWPVHEAGE